MVINLRVTLCDVAGTRIREGVEVLGLEPCALTSHLVGDGVAAAAVRCFR